jgi:predicted DCC family thiol-disulfide oxidoreductase YuxK
MEQRLILFDGECGFCSRLVAFVVARDPAAKFSFAALQSPTGQEILNGAGLPRWDVDTVVLVERDRVYTKSTAALRIGAGLAWPWHLVRVLSIVPRPLRDVAYDVVARNRHRILPGQNHCLLPSAVADRIVDSADLPPPSDRRVE